MPHLLPVNCYLVRESDGFTLIDTAMSFSAKAILHAARQHGVPIARIVLTHAHVDHAGGLDALRTALPDAEICMSGREERLLRGDRRLEPEEPQAGLRGSWPRCKTVPTRRIQGGDRIGSLEVVDAPGHTPGHIAFFDIRDRTLFAGDAFQTQGGIAVAGSLRPLFPLPALATWHKPTALQSARELLRLRPSLLAVGHGSVRDKPEEAMKQAIAALERLLGE